MKRDILKVHRARGFVSLKQAYGKYGKMLPEPSSHHHNTSESAWKRIEHRAARRALNKTALYCVHYGSHGKIGVIDDKDT